MTFVYQHITTDMQLKISPPKLQEHKTAMKGDVFYSTYISLSDLQCKGQHFIISQSLPHSSNRPQIMLFSVNAT